jgi:hypothetical protein
METTEIRHYISKLEKWTTKHHKGLLVGGILGFSLTMAYLFYLKKKRIVPVRPKKIGLDMERYVFDIPTNDGDKQAIVESGGDCYSVTLAGRYLGSMWRDEERGM